MVRTTELAEKVKIKEGVSLSDDVAIPAASPDESGTSSEKITITPVVPGGLPEAWPHVREMVRKSVNWSPFTRKLQALRDVEERLFCGDYKLWLIFREKEVIGAALTSITAESRCRVLDVAYGAGEDVKEWMGQLYNILEDECVEMDCRFIRIEGRAGWGSVLKPLGFEEAYRAFMLQV